MECNDAFWMLTVAPKLQIQIPSTMGKTIQKLTFQPLVKWQNKGQI